MKETRITECGIDGALVQLFQILEIQTLEQAYSRVMLPTEKAGLMRHLGYSEEEFGELQGGLAMLLAEHNREFLEATINPNNPAVNTVGVNVEF